MASFSDLVSFSSLSWIAHDEKRNLPPWVAFALRWSRLSRRYPFASEIPCIWTCPICSKIGSTIFVNDSHYSSLSISVCSFSSDRPYPSCLSRLFGIEFQQSLCALRFRNLLDILAISRTYLDSWGYGRSVYLKFVHSFAQKRPASSILAVNVSPLFSLCPAQINDTCQQLTISSSSIIVNQPGSAAPNGRKRRTLWGSAIGFDPAIAKLESTRSELVSTISSPSKRWACALVVGSAVSR